jgi:hypothetical protein
MRSYTGISVPKVRLPVAACERRIETANAFSDLKAGIYGREPWMAKIQQQMAMAKPSKGIAS